MCYLSINEYEWNSQILKIKHQATKKQATLKSQTNFKNLKKLNLKKVAKTNNKSSLISQSKLNPTKLAGIGIFLLTVY